MGGHDKEQVFFRCDRTRDDMYILTNDGNVHTEKRSTETGTALKGGFYESINNDTHYTPIAFSTDAHQ